MDAAYFLALLIEKSEVYLSTDLALIRDLVHLGIDLETAISVMLRAKEQYTRKEGVHWGNESGHCRDGGHLKEGGGAPFYDPERNNRPGIEQLRS